MPFRETTTTDLTTGNLGFGIDVTNRCNLSCPTCYYLDRPLNRPSCADSHLSATLFRKAMQEAAKAGFREVYILGGEPTVHPGILDLLNYAVRSGFEQVLLVTNGIRLADLAFCRAIAATGADIAVRRHVVDDGELGHCVQDELVGRKGTLPLVREAFANIEGLFSPERVAVQCCITRPVVESGQIYEVFRYAKRNRFGHIIECTKASERFARGNPLDISPDELLETYEKLQSIDILEFGGKATAMTPQAYGKTCHMPENSVHCLIDGTIIPCVGQPFPLGNIFADADGALETILGLPARDYFRYPNKRLQGHCRDCPELAICTGGCRGDAFFLTGCFSASAVQCPRIARYSQKLGLSDFLPQNCNDCALRGISFCGPRTDVRERLSAYLGERYKEDPSSCATRPVGTGVLRQSFFSGGS